MQTPYVQLTFPTTWADITSASIRRGARDFFDIDYGATNTVFKFYTEDTPYQPSDEMTFFINTPRLSEETTISPNEKTSYYRYYLTTTRDFTNVKCRGSATFGAGSFDVNLQFLEGSDWIDVDEAAYDFQYEASFGITFSLRIPVINAGETIRFRVVITEVEGGGFTIPNGLISGLIGGGATAAGLFLFLRKVKPAWLRWTLQIGAPAALFIILFFTVT
jgi:hypothetical protein